MKNNEDGLDSMVHTSKVDCSQKNMIDVLKFFFSFCVVGIHTGILTGLPDQIQWYIMHLVFRLAVPFFFVTSSFFLGRKVREGGPRSNVFRSYRRKLIIPFMFWGALGLFSYSISVIQNDALSVRGMAFYIVRSAIFYPQYAMWFVAACIVGALILEFILIKRWHYGFVTLGTIILFIFALFANTYYFCIEGTFFQYVIDIYINFCVSARNGLFLFVYFWMGYLLSTEHVCQFLKSNDKKVTFLFLASILLFIIEVIFTYGKNVKDDSSLFISFIILVPLLGYKIMNSDIQWRLPYIELRRISSLVFFTHSVVNELVGKIIGIQQGILRFVIVSIMCMLIYFVFRKTKNIYVKKILQI